MYDLLKSAFPDYDLATLPVIPAHWEDVSYRNDACPSFLAARLDESNGVYVFIDYAEPDHREPPASHRFSVVIIGNMEHDSLSTDDWSEVPSMVDRLYKAVL